MIVSTLGELCEISIGKTPSRANERYWGKGTPWLSIADMRQGRNLVTTKEQITSTALNETKCKVLEPGTVVLSFKLSIGKVGIVRVPMATNEAIAALKVHRSDLLHAPYLAHVLSSINLSKGANRAAMGATLNRRSLGAVPIPLPPMAEQLRITEILDETHALRAKRREAIARLDSLGQSIFQEMFGSTPSQEVTLTEVLKAGLRNGLSPSTVGTISAQVLTLGSITGSYLDLNQRKQSLFDSPFHSDQMLRSGKFLICRGNGNRNLVGRAKLVHSVEDQIGYPDTIIAGDIDTERVSPLFMQSVWESRTVRNQIEQGATTTNGTFKVNQKLLSSIRFPLPPRDDQENFATKLRAVERMKVCYLDQLSHLDNLFLSLQDRAFKGEL